MKRLHTFKDDVINKEYDLYVTTLGELKNEIVKSSGMTTEEIRTSFDSMAYEETQEISDNSETYYKEIEQYITNKFKDSILYNRMKKAIQTDNLSYFLLDSTNFYDCKIDSLETIEELKGFVSFIKSARKTSNLSEMIEVMNQLDSTDFKYIQSRGEGFNSYKISATFDIIEGFMTNAIRSDYVSKYELKTYINYLKAETEEEKRELLSDSFFRNKSETYLKDSKISSENYDNKKNKVLFETERKLKATLGMETQYFVVEKLENGKLILLDGFNRLFGSTYENEEKEIMVKVYKNISEEDYGNLVINLNSWKINNPDILVGTNNKLLAVIDRGMLFSMYLKYGINAEIFFKQIVTYSQMLYQNNILDFTERKNFIPQFLLAEKICNKLTELDLGEEFNKYIQKNIISKTDITEATTNEILEGLSREDLNIHKEKIKSFTSDVYVLKYLQKIRQ